MSTSGAFIPLIHGQLAELKKLTKIFHRPLRECIAKTEQYIQELNSSRDQIDFNQALEPFFKSVATKKRSDVRLFQPVVLDCFYNVFRQASPEFYPDREMTHRITKVLISADSAASDEVSLRCCNVCIACLRSASGIFYCHGKLLRQMFKLLFRIYNDSENTNTFNSIKTSIQETLLALFDCYTSPPEIQHGKTIAELSSNVLDGIWQNTEAIMMYLGPVLSDGDYSVTIRDVDVFVVLSLLAKIIEKNKFELRTVQLAADFLVTALGIESKFYSTNASRVLLQTQIQRGVMALALDSRVPLASVTAELILLLSTKFADNYLESLSDTLMKGLVTALTSQDKKVVTRALTVYGLLASHPKLFVNSYVNYDCDESGFFPSVFAATLSQIVKLSYPDAKQTETQKQALKVLVSILGHLWEYFNNPQLDGTNAPAVEVPQNSREARKPKNVMKAGLAIFQKNSKRGLAFFIAHKVIENNPVSIAKYLFENADLDPAGVGDVLGGTDESNREILKAYVSLFDFKGATFEAAFRLFLAKFLISGESQMVGRVMEQFGQKYYSDNPIVFSSADTVYMLSYSTLLLHTDAHHPKVTARITLEQFLSDNKGIDDGKDLPREFLEDLYNGIKATRISCSTGSSIPSTALLTREQRAELFRTEAQDALTQARSRNGTSHGNRVFHKAESPLLIGPMFQTIWRGTLATLAMTFEQSDDRDVYMACLQGLMSAVHIASHCYIDESLTTLVDAFTKFTALKWKKVSEVKQKNIDCCNTLLSIATANADGNFLRNAWFLVLDQISELDKITSIQMAFNYDVNASDELFTSSVRLDRESIVDFVSAMCEKSMEELKENPPRQFLLQKLGVVAHYNIKREHFIWLKIWNHIGKHLQHVGSTFDISLASVTVDILRQVSHKFLEQEELTQFHFQEHFMGPFEIIFKEQSNTEVKEFVLDCIGGLIQDLASNLQSGWSVIFKILLHSSTLPETQPKGFGITQELVHKHLDVIATQFIHVVAIVSSFVTCADDSIKVQAVTFFENVADKTKIDDLPVWESLFESLASSSCCANSEVRKKAHEETVSILDKVLSGIADSFVQDLIQKDLPEYFHGPSVEDELFHSQASEFLSALFGSIIGKFYDDIFSRFFDGVMALIFGCLRSENAQLSSTAIVVLEDFVKQFYEKFDEAKTASLLQCLRDTAAELFKLTLENGKAFISLIVSSVVCFKRMDFIDVLYQIDKLCEASEKERNRFMLWSFTRSSLLRALLVKQDETQEQIVDCVDRTNKLYLDFKFLSHTENAPAISWNEDIVVTLELMSEMPEELFHSCFAKSAPHFVVMVTAKSLKVRSQISRILGRQLL